MGKEALILLLFSVMDFICWIFWFSSQSVKVSKMTLTSDFSHFF